MTLPTVSSLSARLGENLKLTPGFRPSLKTISAVHISELPDPTPYLFGNELLLTTGLTLPATVIGCEKYLATLAEAGISALGFGLGPVHAEVPKRLEDACQSFGITLFVVPTSTPFTMITEAYWTAVSKLTERHLNDALATYRALVNAIVSDDPVSQLLRTLSRALDGWVAVFSPSGSVEQVFPSRMHDDAEAASDRIPRLETSGIHSAASFPVADHVVVLYPMPIEGRIVGYLAAGTTRGLNTIQRGTVTTACALLSLDFAHRERITQSRQVSLRPIALLIDMGLIDAARLLGQRLGASGFDGSVKLLLIRTDHLSAIIRTVSTWCPEAIEVPVDKRHAWLLIPDEHPAIDALKPTLLETDPSLSAIISQSLMLRDVGGARMQLAYRIDHLNKGEIDSDDAHTTELSQVLATKIKALATDSKGDLIPTLVAFLRHRGQWEPAARELGAHRNTVRNRIAKCEDILGCALDDPDASASLWLLLRNKGLA